METPAQVSWEAVVGIATTASVIALIVSLFIAYLQYYVALHGQRQMIASQLWNSYLACALEFPMFAYPNNFEDQFRFDSREFGSGADSKMQFERYEWFVSILFRAADETINEFGVNDHRSRTALQNVGYHQRYLKWKMKLEGERNYILDLSDNLIRHINYIADMDGEPDFRAPRDLRLNYLRRAESDAVKSA